VRGGGWGGGGAVAPKKLIDITSYNMAGI